MLGGQGELTCHQRASIPDSQDQASTSIRCSFLFGSGYGNEIKCDLTLN